MRILISFWREVKKERSVGCECAKEERNDFM